MEPCNLQFQTTLDCTVNPCAFCNMFGDERFHIKGLDGVLAGRNTQGNRETALK